LPFSPQPEAPSFTIVLGLTMAFVVPLFMSRMPTAKRREWIYLRYFARVLTIELLAWGLFHVSWFLCFIMMEAVVGPD
jgi:hypothetical protein